MMGPELGMSWGWGFGMMLSMAVFWALVIGAAIWLATTLTRPRSGGTATIERAAFRVLEDRLARGEIDVDEFRSRRAAMEERAT